MRALRVLLFAVGLAALAQGAAAFADFAAQGESAVALSALTWLLAGPVLHDALFAPLAGLVAFLLARGLPSSWRTPVLAGTAVSGVLVLLAVPLLWRTYGAAPQPGLHDVDPTGSLLWMITVVWALVVVAGTVRTVRAARRRAS